MRSVQAGFRFLALQGTEGHLLPGRGQWAPPQTASPGTTARTGRGRSSSWHTAQCSCRDRPALAPAQQLCLSLPAPAYPPPPIHLHQHQPLPHQHVPWLASVPHLHPSAMPPAPRPSTYLSSSILPAVIFVGAYIKLESGWEVQGALLKTTEDRPGAFGNIQLWKREQEHTSPYGQTPPQAQQYISTPSSHPCPIAASPTHTVLRVCPCHASSKSVGPQLFLAYC